MIERNIVYAPEHGERGQLDLYLPDGAARTEGPSCPMVIVIHGGGLQALSKERMDGVSTFVAEQGWGAVNVNYRLLPDHPFPAQLQDVLRVYRWVQETDRKEVRCQDRTHIALLGASAGGYLAMMAGLILGPERVRSIVSISGPSLHSYFAEGLSPAEDVDPRMLSAPIELVRPGAPPLLATHSCRDTVVGVEHSIAMVRRMREAGCHADLYLYDGLNELHGIWRDDRPMLRLFKHIEYVIAVFLRKTLQGVRVSMQDTRGHTRT